MEKIVGKNSWGHNAGQRHDRENSKVTLESEEQMQDILIKEACP